MTQTKKETLLKNLTINGKSIAVTPGTTILQAAQQAGYEIPVFCYHPKLDIAGNCRMCLVDLEGCGKPACLLQMAWL